MPGQIARAFALGAAGRRPGLPLKRDGRGAPEDPERDALEAWAEEQDDKADREERAAVGIGGDPPRPPQGA